ncbi:MAG: hypothetical protein D6803_03100 [Anaerolineae bacterium]|nr:MAG: hypothetical protein D6803_03100 [Anaerolineae bacterium]
MKRDPKFARISFLLWGVIALYTAFLPSAILVYRRLEAAIGQQATGKIPLLLVLTAGVLYAVYGFRRRGTFAHLVYLLPAAVLTYAVIRLEPNPNKHIHIPEYVVMAWLLYAALSRADQGKGLMLLIWLCGSLLGVVDEVEQGIHPRRFYGWSDMLVNSTGVLVGLLTIQGLLSPRLKPVPKIVRWRAVLPGGALLLYGLTGGVLTCARLFAVQAQERFQGVYPQGLLVWNLTFVVGVLLYFLWQRRAVSRPPAWVRVRLSPLLVIVGAIHALVLWIAVSGSPFR